MDNLTHTQNRYHDEVWSTGALPDLDEEVISKSSSEMSTWLLLQQREIYNESVAAFLKSCLTSQDSDMALEKGAFLSESDQFIKHVAGKTVRPSSAVSKMAQRVGKQDRIIFTAAEKIEQARSAAATLAQCKFLELPAERQPTADSFGALNISASHQPQFPRLQAFHASAIHLNSFVTQNKMTESNFAELDGPLGNYIVVFV